MRAFPLQDPFCLLRVTEVNVPMGKQAYRFSRTSNLMTGPNKLMMGFLYLFSSTLLLSKALEGAVTENSKSDRNLPPLFLQKSSQFPDFFCNLLYQSVRAVSCFHKGLFFFLRCSFFNEISAKEKNEKRESYFSKSIFFMVL